MPNLTGKTTMVHNVLRDELSMGEYRETSFYVDNAVNFLDVINMGALKKKIIESVTKVNHGLTSDEVSTDELLNHIEDLKVIVRIFAALENARATVK